MKFVVSSTELYACLQSVSRVMGSKTTLPVLDNFLFNLHDNILKITASDLETTLMSSMSVENVERDGDAAVPSKLLLDTLKEFPEQPLIIIIDPSTMVAEISWAAGKFNLPCVSADEYPQTPTVDPAKVHAFEMEASMLLEGISKTIFATGDDELRPTMNGVYFDMKDDGLTFVASDAHKLVRYRLANMKADAPCSFILPKKPASLLRNLLIKENNPVSIEFDDKKATFTLSRFKMSCRLIEGLFPAYNSVIPANNPNKITVDRVEILTAVRRVAVFSNQASNLIKLKISGNEINISAQDLDFSVSANERVNCRYDGEDIEIGFKSSFLAEILNNLPSSNVSIELADSSRAGLLLPFENENPDEDLLMLLMPMVIGI